MILKSGEPFWSNTRRAPNPLTFDPNDDLHMDFVFSFANLLAFAIGIPYNRDKDDVR